MLFVGFLGRYRFTKITLQFYNWNRAIPVKSCKWEHRCFQILSPCLTEAENKASPKYPSFAQQINGVRSNFDQAQWKLQFNIPNETIDRKLGLKYGLWVGLVSKFALVFLSHAKETLHVWKHFGILKFRLERGKHWEYQPAQNNYSELATH